MSEGNVSRIGRALFSVWFQLILCIGIISVSIACGTYVWQVWRLYRFEKDAEQLCIAYVEDYLKADMTLAQWRRGLVKEAASTKRWAVIL